MGLGRFNWYPWARYLGLNSGFFILTGGVIGLWYPKMILGVINIVVGLFLMGWNWPVAPFTLLGPFSSNLWIRAVFHAAAIAPSILLAPTSTGAMCLVFAVLMFIRAATNGEKWEPPKPRAKRDAGGKDMSAIKAPEN
ncbi:uncharacterized protein SPPG_02568 [Spizellomyces punctatus DAOM BR117]|uniref:p22-phox n=1 Tax=Spizellomyces punctatus (strain DAOM BR117) TaxID=645134 RepID=A0A0L0HMD6_SPIPD|nr:uncharacterized protein SPPG_02568 [Spizellomyces punctatus DAOM BR117]KND02065.1 hypothetical protein SPPG_02568 [Spizellomyces punctatus DAOM BR117]|eukprot:XP_016610104.1 hypothetical protein SPPG_02568 [Spizellomyces punctatus DAOM BR117]